LGRSLNCPIEVVPNPLRRNFSKEQGSSAYYRPIVLWVGRLDPHKNWRAYIEICRELHARNPEMEYWVVGTSINSSGIAHAFLWNPATGMEDLGTLPDGSLSVAFGVNASGQVVGWGDSPAASSRAFIWTQGGGMVDLVGTGEDSTLAHAINDAGLVVGVAANVAFRWQGGVFTSLGAIPTGGSSEARAVSANGLIVGWSDTETASSLGFLWSPGSMTSLGTLPGGSMSDAYGVNSAGQVVGVADNADGAQRGFLWEAGVMTDLGTLPGGAMSWAQGINESGVIVGVASDAAGRQHAVIWTPNGAPVAGNQSVSTSQGTPIPIVLSGSDPDLDPLTFAVVTGPAHGTLSGAAPNLTYTPAAGYTGSDSFTFMVNDGTVTSAVGTMSISVTQGTTPPDETGGPARITGEGLLDGNGKRHHFELRVRTRASGEERYGRLEYRVKARGHGNNDWFVSTSLTSVTFSDNPDTTPGRRWQPVIDSVAMSGQGKWNGRRGYTFEARAVDSNWEGDSDTAAFTLSVQPPPFTALVFLSTSVTANVKCVT
jgi:probable HAF family extracellular repeat protein